MPFPWRPGTRITAERLRAGALSGTELVVFPGTANVPNSFYNAAFFRASVIVTFPTGFFTTTPFITVAARTNSPGTIIECSYSGASPDGFELYASRVNGTSTNVDWIAMEM